MKEQPMIQSPTFEVNLGGIDLTEPQAKELEKAIQQTTMQFLAKMDNGFLKSDDVFALKPFDSMGVGTGSKEFAFDKRWWFGFRLIKQIRKDQTFRVNETIARGLYPETFKAIPINEYKL